MSKFDDKQFHQPESGSQSDDTSASLIGRKSPGVERIEAIAAHISLWDRVAIFFGVFLIAYAYGLDISVRFSAYQPLATSSFHTHSTLATLNTIIAVVRAATQPTSAKIADIFGRVELVLVSLFFYVLGTIIEASASDVNAFIAGGVLHMTGFTCIILLVEVIVADTTSLRSRVFFSYIPTAPYLINAWISGDVSNAVLKATTWRWGIGMWAIIYTVCALPLILSLWWVGHKAKRAGALVSYKTPYQIYGGKRLVVALFWQLDVIGIILLILVFGLILVPFTVAKGSAEIWATAKIIVPLVLGVLLVPVWIYWEKRAPHPLLPFHLMKDRSVWGALGIAIFFNFAWAVQNDFLFTLLRVSYNESIKSATRIYSMYSFCSVITGILLGLVIVRARRLKPFIVFGTCLFMVSFGIMVRFRGGEESKSGLIGAQVLLGIAGGFFAYPTQASIQAATQHEHVAVITAIYLATYNIGAALGNTVSGAVWSQVVPRELTQRLGNATEADAWFGSPFAQIELYPPGTPQRDAAIEAYKHVQRLLCTTAICLCVPLIAFACCLRNPKLGKEQSLPDAERHDRDATSQGGVYQKSLWQKLKG